MVTAQRFFHFAAVCFGLILVLYIIYNNYAIENLKKIKKFFNMNAGYAFYYL